MFMYNPKRILLGKTERFIFNRAQYGGVTNEDEQIAIQSEFSALYDKLKEIPQVSVDGGISMTGDGTIHVGCPNITFNCYNQARELANCRGGEYPIECEGGRTGCYHR